MDDELSPIAQHLAEQMEKYTQMLEMSKTHRWNGTKWVVMEKDERVRQLKEKE